MWNIYSFEKILKIALKIFQDPILIGHRPCYLGLNLASFPFWNASNIALGSQSIILLEHEQTVSTQSNQTLWKITKKTLQEILSICLKKSSSLDHISIDPAPNIDNVILFKARRNRYDYEISVILLNPSVCSLPLSINLNLIGFMSDLNFS